MSEWHKYFHAMILEVDTPPECVYNEAETRIYYWKLPNRVYVYEANKKYHYGVKRMKDKTHITLMVGTSASEKGATCCSWETEKSIILQTDGLRKATPSIKKKQMLGLIKNQIMVDYLCFLAISPPHWRRRECNNFAVKMLHPHYFWWRKIQATKLTFNFLSNNQCDQYTSTIWHGY